MNLKTKNSTAFPQTEEIPEPLEIHPSVDPELARGLINTIEYLDSHPEEFSMIHGHLENGKGCIICHSERLSSWVRPPGLTVTIGEIAVRSLPLGDAGRLYSPHGWDNQDHNRCTSGRITRIEHFLRTGE